MLIRITEEVADAYDNMAAPKILYPIDAHGSMRYKINHKTGCIYISDML